MAEVSAMAGWWRLELRLRSKPRRIPRTTRTNKGRRPQRVTRRCVSACRREAERAAGSTDGGWYSWYSPTRVLRVLTDERGTVRRTEATDPERPAGRTCGRRLRATRRWPPSRTAAARGSWRTPSRRRSAAIAVRTHGTRRGAESTYVVAGLGTEQTRKAECGRSASVTRAHGLCVESSTERWPCGR